jgi:hypothetical protein
MYFRANVIEPLSTTTPRYLVSLENSTPLTTGFFNLALHLLVNYMTIFFAGLMLRPFCLHHPMTLFKALCILSERKESLFPLTVITRSSANLITSNSNPCRCRSLRSLPITSDHRRDDITPPWAASGGLNCYLLLTPTSCDYTAF